ncbi:DUF4209 domain-containing protein [Pseudomonas sp. W2Aug9]|uniref:DUF4209 domain-containing protein n=1 Tax=Pseudomonas sp. W2Aug9 TaxID=1215242 RepID=UPI002004EA48|nr:hypothetical protein [Pseudomonas sp. W2Aug9]
MTNKDEDKKKSLMDLATLEDFAHIKPASIMAMSNSLHFHTLEHALREAAQIAENTGDAAAFRAYNVLAVVCSYHFNPSRPDTFSPQIIFKGKRTLIPSDYLGEQQGVLVQIAEQIDHPLLRARIADSCWYVNRRLHAVAALAASSYLNAVELFFKKELLDQYESDFAVPFKVVDLIDRAFAIYASAGKRNEIPDGANEVLKQAYEMAKDDECLVAFVRLSPIAQSSGLLEWQEIAAVAEALAQATKDKQYAEVVKKVWLHAARAYLKVDDKESAVRCRVNAVEQTLRMRDSVSTAMAKASWTRSAIGELRAIGGMAQSIELLKKELQQHEDDSLSEFGSFSVPMDLTDERRATIEEFEPLDVHEMLLRLAFTSRAPDKIALHKNCLEKRDKYFFSSMSGKSYADERGKVIATAAHVPHGSEPSGAWFDHESLSEAGLHYHIATEAFIRPACITMSRCQLIDDRHFEPIVCRSEFVPPGFEAIFSQGFSKLVQGDMVSAAHLLIPQLENALRHVLNSRRSNTAKLNVDLTQEDQSLKQLLSNYWGEIEQVFGVDNTYLFHILFNLKGGPMLRHEVAHGKLSTAQCFEPSCIYACWFIFHLTCVPLSPHWSAVIAGAIQEISS